jgi:hypothetical protein
VEARWGLNHPRSKISLPASAATYATIRNRGDGSRPSGNNNKRKGRITIADTHPAPARMRTAPGAGSDPGRTHAV